MFTVEKLENTNQKNDNKKSHLFLLSRDNHCYPVSFKHCHVSKYIFLQKTNHILSAHYNPYYLFFFINLFILFIYFWLCWVFVAVCGLSLVAASRGYSSLWCAGFSLRWLLLLWSTGSRHMGFSSCGTWAQ